ncbi:hypothetical protein L611_004700000070 [Aminobacter sp. J15]|nr:hypothetical protein L611_004700000070 [Aminobacter sp. J15]
MAWYDFASFDTPNGSRTYVVREYSEVDADTLDVEDWGHDGKGPYRDMRLTRLGGVWVEEASTEWAPRKTEVLARIFISAANGAGGCYSTWP